MNCKQITEEQESNTQYMDTINVSEMHKLKSNSAQFKVVWPGILLDQARRDDGEGLEKAGGAGKLKSRSGSMLLPRPRLLSKTNAAVTGDSMSTLLLRSSSSGRSK